MACSIHTFNIRPCRTAFHCTNEVKDEVRYSRSRYKGGRFRGRLWRLLRYVDVVDLVAREEVPHLQPMLAAIDAEHRDLTLAGAGNVTDGDGR